MSKREFFAKFGLREYVFKMTSDLRPPEIRVVYAESLETAIEFIKASRGDVFAMEVIGGAEPQELEFLNVDLQ